MLARILPNVRWTLLIGSVQGAPALDSDGTCYVANREGTLYAIRANGEARWERPLEGIPRGAVAVGPQSVAVALDTGVLRWWRRSDGARRGQVALKAMPAAGPVLRSDERAIVPMMDGQLVSASATAVLWRVRFPGQGRMGAPAVGKEGEVYAGTTGGWLGSVDANGTLRWQLRAGGPVERSPVLAEDGGVYVAAGQEIIALSSEGKVRWRSPAGRRVGGGPLVADDGTVFASVEERRGRGAAIGLDSEGRLRTRIPLAAAPAPSLSLAGHRLWVGLRDGTVRRLSVTQEGLARSSWAKARGDLTNSGAARR